MQVLFETEGRDAIAVSIKKTSKELVILSAFIKYEAIQWIANNLPSTINVSIVARWRLQDLTAGASDLSVYEFARSKGWTFAVNQNMHYKMYLVDQRDLFIGSANLTQKGLHLGVQGNDEATVQVTPSDIDLDKLNRYVKSCSVINDELYAEMKIVVDDANKATLPKSATLSWPTAIKNAMKPVVNQLWVNDLLFNPPAKITLATSEHIDHDLLLMGLTSVGEIADKQKILSSLRISPIWRWLANTVMESENEFVRFGEITAKLHTALVDDPKPYRREVKELLANLYEWIRYLNPAEIGIKKFNHTEALFLRKSSE